MTALLALYTVMYPADTAAMFVYVCGFGKTGCGSGRRRGRFVRAVPPATGWSQKIILISTHEDRAKIGKQFGGDRHCKKNGGRSRGGYKKMTGDLGVGCALECVGLARFWKTVFGAVRPAATLGGGCPGWRAGWLRWKYLTVNVGVKGGIGPPHLHPQLMRTC